MLIDSAAPSNRVSAFGLAWPSALRIRGSVIRLSFPPVVVMTGYGVGIAFLIRKYEHLAVNISIMTPVAVVLSLLMVFRTNSAYDRYWEGRKIWQDLKVSARNLLRNLWCGVPDKTDEDRAMRRQAFKDIVALVISIKHYLRDEDGLDYADYDGLLSPEFRMRVLARGNGTSTYGAICENGRGGHNSPEQGASGSHASLRIQQQQQQQRAEGWERPGQAPLPTLILYEIQKYLEYTHTHGVITAQLYVNVLQQVNVLSGLLGACERILSTPIPLAYHIHLHHSLYLYLLLLPWALGSMGLAKTIILQAVISFMMIGIDAISREIQNPFGYDQNDLPLDDLCEALLVDLNHALACHAHTDAKPGDDTLSCNAASCSAAAGK
ncbi:hypothetical protein H4R18_002251 [Coemansia javaensis]|uniref:Uncharacterized protein n=1 Tax=Coemansia javaensis TaxID=2761396 RepID=A0A9W8LJ16_9FUNG|nr:hypothetical protein H4R18_002251 [Coemansia javaensis]